MADLRTTKRNYEKPDGVNLLDQAALRLAAAMDKIDTDVAQLFTDLANHVHAIAAVTGLQAALDGKAPTAHGHVIGDVAGLLAELNAKLARSATSSYGRSLIGVDIVTPADARAKLEIASLGEVEGKPDGTDPNTLTTTGLFRVLNPVGLAAGDWLILVRASPFDASILQEARTWNKGERRVRERNAASAWGGWAVLPHNSSLLGRNILMEGDAGGVRNRISVYSKAEVDALTSGSGIPAGAWGWFGMSTPPPGWFKGNGAAVSRTTYADLFSVYGTTWGAGDGVNTFNLPDGRGEFIRAWDDGRGVDAGRAFASWQAQQLLSHAHNQTFLYDAFLSGTGGNRYDTTSAPSGLSWKIIRDTHVSSAAGGAENRPRNLAPLFCVKY